MNPDSTADGPQPTAGPGATRYDRFSAVRVDDDLLVYDRDGEEAWLQSNAHVSLEAIR